MDTSLYLPYAVLAFLVVYWSFRAIAGGRWYLKFRGKRLVTCPETNRPTAVEVDAKRAAAKAVFGKPHLQLSECSRWPERRDCAQTCLTQIESAPEECLVRTIVEKWYTGKTCIYCRRRIDQIDGWGYHRPALLDPERKTVQWKEVPAEKLPDLLATHPPVCWNCHLAETFRRLHPELVVDRPWRH